jgi:hypothetical protein
MNRNKIESEVAIAYHVGDSKKVKAIREELASQQSKMDRWFDKYLDMFDEKMNYSQRTDPVWKLYFKKFDEYCELKQSLKTTEYFLRKM